MNIMIISHLWQKSKYSYSVKINPVIHVRLNRHYIRLYYKKPGLKSGFVDRKSPLNITGRMKKTADSLLRIGGTFGWGGRI